MQQLGGTVPNVVLPSLSSESRNLDESLRDKKGAVVLFWSETCSHCVRYDKQLNAFATSHPELALFTICSRKGEAAADIRAAVARRGLEFPIAHDADGAVAREWHTQQTPRAFLVDRERRLLYRGAIDNFRFPEDPEYAAYLEPAIESFLAGEPIARNETASFGCAIESVYYIMPKPYRAR